VRVLEYILEGETK
jgi:hypothetical protein